MHRRLEKMGALFELDWDDGDLLASLVMTLRLLAPAAAAEGTPAFCSDCAAPGCGHEQSR
jgi:hypothetical protein